MSGPRVRSVAANLGVARPSRQKSDDPEERAQVGLPEVAGHRICHRASALDPSTSTPWMFSRIGVRSACSIRPPMGTTAYSNRSERNLMLKKLLGAAVVKRIAASTPLGAAVVVGATAYLRHRRSKQAQEAGSHA
jgi:hypothetical protein